MSQDWIRTASADSFESHLNTSFEISNETESFTAELVEVLEHKNSRGAERDKQFALLLLAGEIDNPTQSTYQIKHPELGEFDLFLVPIGPSAETGGMQFEAVFS